MRCIPNLHLGAAKKGTPKKGKPRGRPIGDLTYGTGMPLNNDMAIAAATDFYGDIKYPTILKIICMIMSFWQRAVESEPSVDWSNLRLRKMDLKGAYTLLSFQPEDAGLFGMEVN